MRSRASRCSARHATCRPVWSSTPTSCSASATASRPTKRAICAARRTSTWSGAARLGRLRDGSTRAPVPRQHPALRRRAAARRAQRGEPRLAAAVRRRSSTSCTRSARSSAWRSSVRGSRSAAPRWPRWRNATGSRATCTTRSRNRSPRSRIQLESAQLLAERGDAARAGETIERTLQLTRAALGDARRSVLDLRAPPLEGRGLLDAIAWLAAATCARREGEPIVVSDRRCGGGRRASRRRRGRASSTSRERRSRTRRATRAHRRRPSCSSDATTTSSSGSSR